MRQPAFQDRIFQEGESDAWYLRNAVTLSQPKLDRLGSLVVAMDRAGELGSVCDLGCANGWCLAALKPHLPAARQFVGVDPSRLAIEAGRARWPDLRLELGALDDIPVVETFDLVMVSFVLCWLDRASLARAVAEVDRLVKPGGVLVVSDFMADEPVRVPYHHRKDVALFTYKQDYAAPFRALRSYRETFRVEYDDSSEERSLVPTRSVQPRDRSFISFLTKEV